MYVEKATDIKYKHKNAELKSFLSNIFNMDNNFVNTEIVNNLQVNFCIKDPQGNFHNHSYIKLVDLQKSDTDLSYLVSKEDMYYTIQPTFSNKVLQKEIYLANNSYLVSCYCNFLIDIDLHTNLNRIKELKNILLNARMGEILDPAIVFSGRGFQLIYSFTSVSKNLEFLYKEVQGNLINLIDTYLKKYNFNLDKITSNKLQSLARLPLTINSKTNSKTKIIKTGKLYTIDILKELLETKTEKKVITNNDKNIINLSREIQKRQSIEDLKSQVKNINFFRKRLEKLENIVGEIKVGYRHNYLLITWDTVRLFKTEQESRETILSLNSLLGAPLEVKEARHIFNNKTAYKWKIETIKEVLNLDIGENRIYKTNKIEREKRNQEIKRLYSKKYTQKQLSEQFGLSLPQIKRIVNS